MIKLTRFFLPVCIFLLTGFIRHNENTNAESVTNSSLKNFEGSFVNSCVLIQNGQDSGAKSIQSDIEKESSSDHIANLEEKEDELPFSKKYQDFSNNFNPPFYTQLAGYFSQHSKPVLFFYRNFSYFPSYRYLYRTLQVFRI
jgi:hypothetical protein